ncbi:bacteriocin resistance YdeI/OmpD-like protein [Chitinophaga polysaccharea]|uniref:Bacteriocin resistance YdeI/OmpD-like protein n=1 Tax=Chitinophaga polysaccharea TaxID=1293035 RepID=A0A561PB26_9BACT|nr:YdeI/OmpD-associated family protein [Chitinophaga polysaccharea]TWF35343.1 bacteriocin resistance YdeI/OmpD-like protein [Chitinophaga polysaccharea]
MDTPLIDKVLPLERFDGKGGWTFIRLPDLPKGQGYFGMRKVSGFIDQYELPVSNLMPLKKGVMMLPVKAAIRKQIRKEAGEQVRLILYPVGQQTKEIIPTDFLECLQDEPEALRNFQASSPAEQGKCLQWIMEVTVPEARIQRMADAINHLAAGRSYLGTKSKQGG